MGSLAVKTCWKEKQRGLTENSTVDFEHCLSLTMIQVEIPVKM